MSNQKKILMAVAIAVLGLSSCGRENYNGTYTGFQSPTATTTGTTNYNPYYNYSMQGSAVTASLTGNGDSVTGTYQLTASVGMTATSYQFQANSSQSGQLTAVYLYPTSMMGSTFCGALTGTLSSTNRGQMITGTLAPIGAAANSGAQNVMCPSVQVSLTRNN